MRCLHNVNNAHISGQMSDVASTFYLVFVLPILPLYWEKKCLRTEQHIYLYQILSNLYSVPCISPLLFSNLQIAWYAWYAKCHFNVKKVLCYRKCWILGLTCWWTMRNKQNTMYAMLTDQENQTEHFLYVSKPGKTECFGCAVREPGEVNLALCEHCWWTNRRKWST